MNCLYKIDTVNASSATFIHRYIQSMGGQSLRKGNMVITDFDFDVECPPASLLSHISDVNTQLSESDFEQWVIR